MDRELTIQITSFSVLKPTELKVEVKNVWEYNRKNNRLNFLYLCYWVVAPFSDNLLSVQECNRILLATFRYIK